MSLTEPTASPAFGGDDAIDATAPVRLPAASPTTWSYLRTLTGAPDGPAAPPAHRARPADDGTDWADDARLDELFSAWAKAALAADVVSGADFGADFGGTYLPDAAALAPRPEVAAPAAAPLEDALLDGPHRLDGPEGGATATATVTVTTTTAAAGDPAVDGLGTWSRGDDDVIPRRRRGRWGRRRG